MRLPIQPMQGALIKPAASGEDGWYRSAVTDFTPDESLVLLLPSPGDLVKPLPPPDSPEAEEVAEAEAEAPEDVIVDGKEKPFIPLDRLFAKGTAINVEISFADGIRQFDSVVRKIDNE